MYSLQSEASFDAAHFLFGYQGKCKNIHGHCWRVVATIEAEALQEHGPERGMLTDFGNLKRDLKTLCDRFDHSLILEEGSLKEATLQALMEEDFHLEFLPFRTTAENFSKYFFDALSEKGYPVSEIRVYETPTNCACYTGKKEEPHIVHV